MSLVFRTSMMERSGIIVGGSLGVLAGLGSGCFSFSSGMGNDDAKQLGLIGGGIFGGLGSILIGKFHARHMNGGARTWGIIGAWNMGTIVGAVVGYNIGGFVYNRIMEKYGQKPPRSL